MPDLIRHFFYCTHLAYVGALVLTSYVCPYACWAPSEPTYCTSEMSINKFIAASSVYKRFT